ncbi:SDR family oxidoreductase [Streptomyces lincolnensis]|uniref:SDR family NAD(P)-dependent oxidoreductase n=1 Tax=Streptomyces lincolnensis TaxID=1915 RepID=UPI001E4AB00D|nr:SDR family oxidoreductase [Streptomyces lincolnensis]MCD7439725.1 SDR family oxidoreductase [Streptomyces lincolnensis]
MKRFEGRTVVVTGGSTGLGLGAAERFVAEGATVYLVGRRQSELDAAVARLGPAAVAVRADVTVNDDLDRLYATLAEADGQVDVVVANAGAPSFGTIETYTGEELDASYALNLRAVAFTVQKALPLMPEGGSIVLVSSIEGERGSPGLGAYAAMKSAQQSMARTWANELRERRIRVNAISPGVVYTHAYEAAGVNREQAEAVIPLIPAGRLGLESEIAAAIAFLASEDASFVNGANLVVDGGQTEIV